MHNPHNGADKVPLKTITKSGIYMLKLSKPKADKVRVWDDGTMSYRLFLMWIEILSLGLKKCWLLAHKLD